MRARALIVVLGLVLCFSAFAQDIPRVEVFGGM
jgi:hypothetical protein